MKLQFTGTTNSEYDKVKCLRVKFEDTDEDDIVVGRKKSSWYYDEDTDEFRMIWYNCYLYEPDEENIFSNSKTYIFGKYGLNKFIEAIQDGKLEFEYTDDAEEDYCLKIETLGLLD